MYCLLYKTYISTSCIPTSSALLSEQRNTTSFAFTLAYLNRKASLAIEPPVLLTAQYACTCARAFFLRRLHTPVRQKLAYTLALIVRVNSTDVQVPTLSAIASPILLGSGDSDVKERGS